mmetsp:Transcript_23797/g.32733  ORF Transcript_23797/g.32733 Transcript_23797/m.32733 type:complete len:946 (+) Transcript_23797:23-2860(+)
MIETIRRLSTGGIFSNTPPLEDHLSRFLVQAAIIIGFCRTLSIIGSYLKQPRVIFEIIGGILLGPSAIGRDGTYLEQIFPKSSLSYLGLVAEIGLVLYLFLVGLELDPKLLLSHARKAGGIAVMGMAVPFVLGIAISQVMFDVLQPEDLYSNVSAPSFFVFIGTAMSITAFPVLARILKEGGLIYTPPGAMAMGAAALNDAIAWCLLVLAISIANSGNLPVAGYVFSCVAGFAMLLFVVVRPLLEVLVSYVESQNNEAMSSNLFSFTLCMVFVCAFTTAVLGVDAIFGSFIFGLIIPRNSRLFHNCVEKIEDLVVSFTLPLYFTLSGLKTDVTTIRTKEEAAITVLVCVVASFGKFIGCGGTALLSGMSVRESAVVASLMNTRGLVELIVLNLGLQAGILSVRTFSVMVIMCLFTTFITCPLIELIYPRRLRTRNVDGEASHDDVKQQLIKAESDDTIGAQSAADIEVLSRDMRLGLVVDSLEQLQELLQLLALFLPQKTHSVLSVTAMRFIEPTLTTRDEFLALDEEGRLLRVDEESTDLAVALRDMHDPTIKKPELLPLSMFCRAMGTNVNVFRIQGNPDEFPSELKQLTAANDSHFVLMPWRQSHYLQKFFWHSLNTVSMPLALVVHLDNNDVSDHVNTQTHHAFEGSNSNSSARGVSGQHSHGMDVAYRSMRRRRSTISRHSEISKLPTAACPTLCVVAVLQGVPMDVLLLRLLMRFVENGSRVVHLLIPGDFNTFESSIVSAFCVFRAATNDFSSVHITVLDDVSHLDLLQLKDHFSALPCDLFMCSFSEAAVVADVHGDSDIESGIHSPPHHTASAHIATPPSAATESRLRSSTITALAEVVMHVPTDSEKRSELGVPDSLLTSSLQHVELGAMGCAVFEMTATHTTNQSDKNSGCGGDFKPTMMMVLHEPKMKNFLRTRLGSIDTMTHDITSIAVSLE